MVKLIAIEPMGAPRMTQRDRWKGRPVVERYHAYKDTLRLALPSYALPEVLRIEFHIAIPKSYSKKKRLSLYGQYHTEKPDIDNLVKAFMDTFGSDAHVAVVRAGKYWCAEGEAPCIVLDT